MARWVGIDDDTARRLADNSPVLDDYGTISLITTCYGRAPHGFGDSEKLDDDNKLIVRAMIAFAAADGRVDLSERDRVLMQLGTLGLSDRDTRFIMQEFQAPADLDDILSSLHLAESRDTLVKRIRAMTDPSNPDEVAFLSKVEGG